jgi:hypothetical protein
MFRLSKLALALSTSSLALIGFQAPSAHAATGVPAQSRLVGELGVEGGAYPGGFHPTAGEVEVIFDGPNPLALLKKVGPSGHFKILLPSGKYTVIGCGPGTTTPPIGNNCSKPITVELLPGQLDKVQLVWAYVP